MPRRKVDIDSLEVPVDRWDMIIECILIGLLFFMPLTFGAVFAWSEMVVIMAAAAMSIFLMMKLLLCRSFYLRWTWIYVPVALFLLLAVFQLIPLPKDIAISLSPQTVDTKTELLSDLGDDAGLEHITLSFYSYATKHDLRLLLVAATVFFVVINIYRHPRQIKRLLMAIAVIGGIFAVLALLQVITGATGIYWTFGSNRGTAGSFLNYSHYCQFMNMSLGAAIGLLLVRLQELARDEPGSSVSVKRTLNYIRSHSLGWLVVMIVLGAITVFTSMSRNGCISLVIASTVTGVALASSPGVRWRTWGFATVLLLAFMGLLLVGFDAVYDRLATLQSSENDWRWGIISGTLAAWQQYPIWGTGLGTHEFIFPMFDTAVIPSLAAHADCDYAQLLEETGVIGFGLTAIFLAGISWTYLRVVRSQNAPISAAAFGLGFGLVAILVHSMSDFGQHLPANFCLSAIACGLLVCLWQVTDGRATGEDTSEMQLAGHHRIKWWSIPMLVGVLAVWGWALFDANAARLGEKAWAKAMAVEDAMSAADNEVNYEQFTNLLSHAQDASESQPANVKYRYRLNYYRWQSISQDVAQETGMVVLHPEALTFVERIADEFAQTRKLCTTYGPPYSVEGQLRLFVLGQPEGGELIVKGYQLAPNDAPTCFIAGVYAAQKGDLEEAALRFTRAVALDGSMYLEVVEIYVVELHRPDLARALAGDNYHRLNQLSRSLIAATEAVDEDTDENLIKEYSQLAEEINADAIRLLIEICKSNDATAGDLATLAGLHYGDKDFQAAITYYRRALNLNYGQVHWRMALARALAETGQVDQAIHEARRCLRLRPQLQAARKLIEDMSVQQPE